MVFSRCAPPSVVRIRSVGQGLFVVVDAKGFAIVGKFQFQRHVFGYHVFVSRRREEWRRSSRPKRVQVMQGQLLCPPNVSVCAGALKKVSGEVHVAKLEDDCVVVALRVLHALDLDSSDFHRLASVDFQCRLIEAASVNLWRRDPLLAAVTGLNLKLFLQPRAFRLVLPLDNCFRRFTLHARVSCQPSEPLRPVHRCLRIWAGGDPARDVAKERRGFRCWSDVALA